jgi:hypothetical protein
LDGNFWSSGRDIVITVFGVLSIFLCLLTIILLLFMISLLRSLKRELTPTLQSTRVTASTIQATVRIVSELVVRPVAAGVGFVALFTTLSRSLLGGGAPRKGGRK